MKRCTLVIGPAGFGNTAADCTCGRWSVIFNRRRTASEMVNAWLRTHRARTRRP